MGLFSKKETCSICGDDKGFKVADGFVCRKCMYNCGIFAIPIGQNRSLASVSDYQIRIKKNEAFLATQNERKQLFTPNKIIGDRIMFDDNHMLWSLAIGTLKKKPSGSIYSIDDIEDYEIDEDGDTIVKGGLGRAVVGGLAFGGVGAVVGGVTGGKKSRATCTKLNVIIKIKDFEQKTVIPLITSEVKKKSATYRIAENSAKSLAEFLEDALENNKPEETNSSGHYDTIDPYEEIKKAKELLDMGIITQEEFDIKKKKLLDL